MEGIIHFVRTKCVGSRGRMGTQKLVNDWSLKYTPTQTHCICSFLSVAAAFNGRSSSAQKMHPFITIVLLINRLCFVTREGCSRFGGDSDVLWSGQWTSARRNKHSPTTSHPTPPHTHPHPTASRLLTNSDHSTTQSLINGKQKPFL